MQSFRAPGSLDCASHTPKHRCVLQDHLALFMELLGRMPLRVTRSGKYAAELFNKRG